MTREKYLAAKLEREKAVWQPRLECPRCLKAAYTCYCSHIKPLRPATQFVVLIHPHEVSRSIASGRMTHLCLANSSFFEGINFTSHPAVNALIADPNNYPVVLSPGENSTNLSTLNESDWVTVFPSDKKLVVFLIDGTWSQANKIKRRSLNLKPLPHVCFTPTTPSQFLVRRQPRSYCYSTIEAVHYFIELVEQPATRHHDNLIDVFTAMVNQQIDFEVRHGRRATRGQRVSEALRTF